jgi:hypothetical protein
MGRRIIVAVISFVAFSGSWVCLAQSGTGSIYGRVTDANDHSVTSASITITGPSADQKIRATTDNEGLYSVSNLSSGDYTLELTLRDSPARR